MNLEKEKNEKAKSDSFCFYIKSFVLLKGHYGIWLL